MSLAATARAAACSTSVDTARRLVVHAQNRASMRLAATARAAWKRGGHDILPRMPRETLLKSCLNNLSSSPSEADLGAMAEISRGTSERENTDVLESTNVASPPTVTPPCQQKGGGALYNYCSGAFSGALARNVSTSHRKLKGAGRAEGCVRGC